MEYKNRIDLNFITYEIFSYLILIIKQFVYFDYYILLYIEKIIF